MYLTVPAKTLPYKEIQLQLMMSTMQCSVVTFFAGSCRVLPCMQIMKSLHLNFKQILLCIMLLHGLPI